MKPSSCESFLGNSAQYKEMKNRGLMVVITVVCFSGYCSCCIGKRKLSGTVFGNLSMSIWYVKDVHLKEDLKGIRIKSIWDALTVS